MYQYYQIMICLLKFDFFCFVRFQLRHFGYDSNYTFALQFGVTMQVGQS